MKLPVFRRGVRVKPQELRAEKEKKMEERTKIEVLERVRAHFAEFTGVLDDPDVADRILDGRPIFELWVRRAMIKRRDRINEATGLTEGQPPEETNV